MSNILPDIEIKKAESVIGFIIIGGLILCLKRTDDDKFYPGKWCFPIGKVHNEKSPVESLFNEVKEETGLYRTNDISFVGKYKVMFKKRNIEYKISAYQLYYNFPVQFILSDKYSELKLCTPEEVQELDLAGSITKNMLSEYLKRIGILNDDSEEE